MGRGIFLNLDSHNAVVVELIVGNFAFVFYSVDIDSTFSVFVDKVEFYKSPTLNVSQSK